MRLQQVILSYYGNAIKFTPAGGTVIVNLNLERNKNGKSFLTINVLDNGPGISKEGQNKLFKVFGYLEESRSKNKEGIGLGLYITKSIVTQFNGEVWVESEIGKGSTFGLFFELEKY